MYSSEAEGRMIKVIIVTITSIILNLYPSTCEQSRQFRELKDIHRPRYLNAKELTYISNIGNMTDFNERLDNILISRVVGTENHEKVFNYIKRSSEESGWHVEVDEFTDKNVPRFGTLKFKNIVATLDPKADRFLVLACHYDSKFFEKDTFYGATDSAVPCGMMLNLMKTMNTSFNRQRNHTQVSLKMIYFDGEEAFISWGPNDSIYGAKHLARKMARTRSDVTVNSSKGQKGNVKGKVNDEVITAIDQIDMLILLDLLGAKYPRFYSLHSNTERWFTEMYNIERRFYESKLLSKSYEESNTGYFFNGRSLTDYNIEDDHLPFLHRGVPILHIIPVPFPNVWHTISDNRDIVDSDTVEDLNKILRAFVAEYLHLSIDDKTGSETENTTESVSRLSGDAERKFKSKSVEDEL